MPKDFEIVARYVVSGLSEEEEEWMREDTGDFLLDNRFVDSFSVDSITEIR